MPTRAHVHEEEFGVTPQALFDALVTPSAIRDWWGAARVVVVPREGGTWAAAWGDDEDRPDYVSAARMAVLDPPRRLVLRDQEYHARTGPLPFQAEWETEFVVRPTASGARLRVRQDGFPEGAAGDEFLRACADGWRDTFAGLRRHLEGEGR